MREPRAALAAQRRRWASRSGVGRRHARPNAAALSDLLAGGPPARVRAHLLRESWCSVIHEDCACTAASAAASAVVRAQQRPAMAAQRPIARRHPAASTLDEPGRALAASTLLTSLGAYWRPARC